MSFEIVCKVGKSVWKCKMLDCFSIGYRRKIIVAPPRDMQEVKNVIATYDLKCTHVGINVGENEWKILTIIAHIIYTEIKLHPKTDDIFAIVFKVKLCVPPSHLDTSVSVFPTNRAKSFCDIPRSSRMPAILSAMANDKSI